MRRKKQDPIKPPTASPPGLQPDNRFQQIAALGLKRLEERLISGEATGQEIVYAIQFADPLRPLKKAKLKSENALLQSKKDAIDSAQKSEELYANAIAAMKQYQGRGDDDQDIQSLDGIA
jgi:hypothetical protein|nr:MAG TPA: hypothetical protein [Caudoviricetes sp.]